MKVNSLAGNMSRLRGALPLPDGTFMLRNEPASVINPNGIVRGFYCNFVANILNRDTVKCAVILNVEISPYRRQFLII